MLGRRSLLRLLAVPFALPFLRKVKPKAAEHPAIFTGLMDDRYDTDNPNFEYRFNGTNGAVLKAPAEAPRGLEYWIENGC